MDTFTTLWTVKLGDVGRAFVVAVLAGPLGILYDWAMMENFQLNWRSVVKGAVAGGAGYLLKNVVTGANGKILSNK